MSVPKTFPRIETANLTLRELDEHDLSALFHIFSDPEVTRFYNIPTFTCQGDAKSLLDRRRNRFYKQQGICWGMTFQEQEEEIVGTCGFNAWHRQKKVGDLGYELSRDYWNQGVMTEALRAVVIYGFDVLGLVQQRAWVMPENKASAKVLTKIGFQSKGVQLARGYWNSQFHDLELFTATIPNPPEMIFPI
jgi:ribosomal-protein-alanine N-acetyltransferase